MRFSTLSIKFQGLVHFLVGRPSSNAAFSQQNPQSSHEFWVSQIWLCRSCELCSNEVKHTQYQISGTCTCTVTFSHRRAVHQRCIQYWECWEQNLIWAKLIALHSQIWEIENLIIWVPDWDSAERMQRCWMALLIFWSSMSFSSLVGISARFLPQVNYNKSIVSKRHFLLYKRW